MYTLLIAFTFLFTLTLMQHNFKIFELNCFNKRRMHGAM